MQDAPAKDLPYFPITEYTDKLFNVKYDEVEILDVPSRTWFNISTGHIIRIAKGLHIFMRRCGIVCKDFDHHYQLFLNPPTLTNIRTNLQGERAFIRAQAREKRLGHRYETSDSEVEVLHSPVRASQPRKPKKSTSKKSNLKSQGKRPANEVIEISSDDSPPSKRARVGPVKSEPVEDFYLATDSDRPVSGNSSPMPTSPIPTPSSPMPVMTSNTSSWPTRWYAKDVIHGLKKMHEMRKAKIRESCEERFTTVFPGVTFVNSTYYDALKRLQQARQEDLEKAVLAGRTPQGRWSHLAKTIPLRTN